MLVIRALLLSSCVFFAFPSWAGEQGAPRNGAKFMNTEAQWKPSVSKLGSLIKAAAESAGYIARPSRPIPLRPIPHEELASGDQPVLYRLGHSTVLIHEPG